MSDNKEKEYDPSRRRNIIKNILIVFLLVMLVLTLFSNTIMNRSLPEIQTERVASGKLTERIRKSGPVEANQSYEVKIEGNKTIDEIKIKAGQQVKKDDVLFITGTEENPEIITQEEAVETLELEYQKALLAEPEDYSKEDQAIRNARADLNAAIDKRNKAYANSGSVAQEKADLQNLKRDLSSKTARQEELKAMILALDTDDFSAAPPEMTGQLVSLQKAAVSAETDYNTVYSLYAELIKGKSEPSTDESSVQEQADLSAQIEEVRKDLEEKEEAKNKAESDYTSAKESLRRDLVSQLTDVNNSIDDINNKLAGYEDGAGTAMSLEEYDADVVLKQRTLEDLIIELNDTKKTDSITSKSATLDLDAQKKKIEREKKKLEKMKTENETAEVKSKYNGIVRSVDIKPGEATVPDVPVAVIDISEEGYTLKVKVEGDKAKRVKVGTEAEVINNWNGDIKATVKEIRNDTVPNSKDREIVFNVEGEVDPGTSLDLSIPLGSGNYDAVVPKSAVYPDSKGGNFVLIVESKSSPLGNRYYAEKVAVEILASDETSSAVQGEIQSGDFIITTASKPVKPKDQVRMKDK
ncbi:MAG: HlyD family efflux transporter periplasmic adaptor subunit [Ruminococcus sp.]|nr:HlyD family efflux transporter periplasmic adaptor subunit [Ruminococcus sp.]